MDVDSEIKLMSYCRVQKTSLEKYFQNLKITFFIVKNRNFDRKMAVNFYTKAHQSCFIAHIVEQVRLHH